MLCAEFHTGSKVILSEIVHVLKAVVIFTGKHLNLSTIFVVSAKVSPEWRLNPGFGTQKQCPFPLSGGGGRRL